MKKYDIIAVLGNGFTEGWDMPDHVYSSLAKVAALYSDDVAPKIAVCGKWSINWDLHHIEPPKTEAQTMADALIELGVHERDIIQEYWSKDTIGNAYFLKTKILKGTYKNILVVCADFHLKRAKALFEKIYDDFYTIDFFPTKTEKVDDIEFMNLQKKIQKRQLEFLKDMKKGDETYLRKRLYNDPYYKKKRPLSIAKAAMGRT